jgi:hypothetical protein
MHEWVHMIRMHNVPTQPPPCCHGVYWTVGLNSRLVIFYSIFQGSCVEDGIVAGYWGEGGLAAIIYLLFILECE